ncbi:hypothetical protein PR202_ga14864 [Eleusine coracana subsp. coracana]|uniref:Uncharacterized protein n=1 Tax=Eleusine coracana subsp. coracana TaxID=191504 RepID=A0AAV5CIN7_ELECO|nr:hypothetical protein PR202_ga14864 [Eleusine coracana subsp. coracana]
MQTRPTARTGLALANAAGRGSTSRFTMPLAGSSSGHWRRVAETAKTRLNPTTCRCAVPSRQAWTSCSNVLSLT